MILEKTYVIKVSMSDRNGCGVKQELPNNGKIRGIVELGLSDIDNVSVTIGKED